MILESYLILNKYFNAHRYCLVETWTKETVYDNFSDTALIHDVRMEKDFHVKKTRFISPLHKHFMYENKIANLYVEQLNHDQLQYLIEIKSYVEEEIF